MNVKYISLFFISILSACGGERGGSGNLDNGNASVIPGVVSTLIFNAPINKEVFLFNEVILIDFSHITQKGRIEIDINNGEESLITLVESPFTYLWNPLFPGKKELRAQFFSDKGELISKGMVEIDVMFDALEGIQIFTNVGQIVDVQMGETLTLTATSSQPVSKVEFLFNNIVVKTFNKTPYTFDWKPGEWDKKDFSVRATSTDGQSSVLVPKSTVIRSFSTEALLYCDDVAKPWREEQEYSQGEYVKHKNKYFTAKFFTMQEPKLENDALNPWSNISCDNLTWLTRPFIFSEPPGGRFNNGDLVKIGINIQMPQNTFVSIKNVIAHRNGDILQTLSNDLHQFYNHTFQGDTSIFPEDKFEIKVQNIFNQISTRKITLYGNIPPSHHLEIRQDGYTSGDYLSTSPIVLFSTVRDVENKVDYLEYFINDVSQGRLHKPGTSLNDVYYSLDVTLPPGEYHIRAKAVDDDGGITEVIKSIVVR